MRSKTSRPENGFIGAVCKFFGSALFGALVSLVIFLVITYSGDIDAFTATAWVHILWVIPLLWGVLGIFFFDQMLDLARKIIGGFFGSAD